MVWIFRMSFKHSLAFSSALQLHIYFLNLFKLKLRLNLAEVTQSRSFKILCWIVYLLSRSSTQYKLLFKTTLGAVTWYLKPPLGAAKPRLKQQVVCDMRVAKTCPCVVNTFLLIQYKLETIFPIVATHLWLYTQISYIFVVQSLYKRWFQAYTSLPQGTSVLYCCPILQVNGSVRAKSGKFSVQNHQCMEFRS